MLRHDICVHLTSTTRVQLPNLVPRPLPAFCCFTRKSGRAWSTFARDHRTVVELYPRWITARDCKPTARLNKVPTVKLYYVACCIMYLTGPRRNAPFYHISILSRTNVDQALPLFAWNNEKLGVTWGEANNHPLLHNNIIIANLLVHVYYTCLEC